MFAERFLLFCLLVIGALARVCFPIVGLYNFLSIVCQLFGICVLSVCRIVLQLFLYFCLSIWYQLIVKCNSTDCQSTFNYLSFPFEFDVKIMSIDCQLIAACLSICFHFDVKFCQQLVDVCLITQQFVVQGLSIHCQLIVVCLWIRCNALPSLRWLVVLWFNIGWQHVLNSLSIRYGVVVVSFRVACQFVFFVCSIVSHLLMRVCQASVNSLLMFYHFVCDPLSMCWQVLANWLSIHS